jgi:MinD-like ATPase involved in chromosome partitioning or flagellar assembly
LPVKGKRVCIIDTDIQSPGVHVFFGLQPEDIKQSLNGCLWGKCNNEDAVMAITKDEVKDARGNVLDNREHPLFAEIRKNCQQNYFLSN